MESYIKIKASFMEMADAVSNKDAQESFNILSYEIISPGVYSACISHTELLNPLMGTFTFSDLRKTLEYSIEKGRYDAALKHFNIIAGSNIGNSYVQAHAEELVYCFENGKSIADFDFWTRYEILTEEKITFDEYIAIDNLYEGDPHDIDVVDIETISEIKDYLLKYRQNSNLPDDLDYKKSIDTLISSAEVHEKPTHIKSDHFKPEIFR